MQTKHKKQRGGTSIIAVFFVALFAVLALSFTAMSNVNVQMSRNHHHMAAAQSAAESGLQYAGFLIDSYISEEQPYTFEQSLSSSDMMNLFTDFSSHASSLLDGSLVLSGGNITGLVVFSEGGLTGRQFSIPALQLSPGETCQFSLLFRQFDDTPESIEVISEGTRDNVQRRVQLNSNIVKDRSGLFDFALFGRESLMLHNGVTVDAYNLDAGDDPLQVGTNGTDPGNITLKSSATIEGDVLVGAGGDPDEVIELNSGADITGEESAMDEEWVPPLVEVPDALNDSSSLGSINNTSTITTSGKYDSINLGNSETLRIEGNVELYIVGDIDLGNSAAIEIAPGAQLTLFLGGDLDICNSAQLNNLTEDASKLIILALDTCEDIIFKNGGIVYASIYAPDADVEFKNSVELHGSVVADNFYQHNSADFHYDVNLRDVNIIGTRACISITRDGNSFVEF